MTEEKFVGISWLYIMARDSAWHVSMIAQYIFGLAITISQSGENADRLAALREAKNRSLHMLGIVNVVGSSIAREADSMFYALADPEISVATTKAYFAQLAACYTLTIQFAKVRGEIKQQSYLDMNTELQTLPDKITRILEDKEKIQWVAAKFANAHNVFCSVRH